MDQFYNDQTNNYTQNNNPNYQEDDNEYFVHNQNQPQTDGNNTNNNGYVATFDPFAPIEENNMQNGNLNTNNMDHNISNHSNAASSGYNQQFLPSDQSQQGNFREGF